MCTIHKCLTLALFLMPSYNILCRTSNRNVYLSVISKYKMVIFDTIFSLIFQHALKSSFNIYHLSAQTLSGLFINSFSPNAKIFFALLYFLSHAVLQQALSFMSFVKLKYKNLLLSPQQIQEDHFFSGLHLKHLAKSLFILTFTKCHIFLYYII